MFFLIMYAFRGQIFSAAKGARLLSQRVDNKLLVANKILFM